MTDKYILNKMKILKQRISEYYQLSFYFHFLIKMPQKSIKMIVFSAKLQNKAGTKISHSIFE